LVYLAIFAVPLLLVVGGISLLIALNSGKSGGSGGGGPRLKVQELKCTARAEPGGLGEGLRLRIKNEDRDLFNVLISSLEVEVGPLGQTTRKEIPLLGRMDFPVWKKGEEKEFPTKYYERIWEFSLKMEAAPQPETPNLRGLSLSARGDVVGAWNVP